MGYANGIKVLAWPCWKIEDEQGQAGWWEGRALCVTPGLCSSWEEAPGRATFREVRWFQLVGGITEQRSDKEGAEASS